MGRLNLILILSDQKVLDTGPIMCRFISYSISMKDFFNEYDCKIFKKVTFEDHSVHTSLSAREWITVGKIT